MCEHSHTLTHKIIERNDLINLLLNIFCHKEFMLKEPERIHVVSQNHNLQDSFLHSEGVSVSSQGCKLLLAW